MKTIRHLILYAVAIASAFCQTLPSPIYTQVTANSTTGALRTPSTFWTANAAAIGSALSLNATYQPLSANLTTWAAKTPYSGNLSITSNRTLSVTGNITLTATANSTLAIGTGGTLGSAAYTAAGDYQPLSLNLTALTNMDDGVDNTFPYFNSGGYLTAEPISAAGRALVAAADAAAQRTALGLGTGNLTSSANSTVTLAGNGTLTLSGNGTLGSAAYTSSAAYEVPLTCTAPLNRSGNTISALTATSTASGIVPGLGGAITSTGNALTVGDYALIPTVIMAWERVLTATTLSGTTEGNAGIYYGIGTGTTAGATSRVDSNSSVGDPWYYGSRSSSSGFGASDQYIIGGLFNRMSSTANGVWRLGWGKSHGAAVGQWTEAGFGFTCKNQRLWSFTHNGTTFTETDTGVDTPGGEVPLQFAIRRTATAFEFFLNRTLVATHTVTGYAVLRFIRVEATNGADAAAQGMRVSPITFRFL